MKNRILVLLWAVLVIALLLAGCGDGTIYRYHRFQTVEKYNDCIIAVDRDTGIGYFMMGDRMCPVYKSDGELYRPNGWRDYGE